MKQSNKFQKCKIKTVKLFSAAILLVNVFLAGCSDSGISRSDYNDIHFKLSNAQKTIYTKDTEISKLTSEKNELESQISVLENQITDLQAEYNSYKEKMKEYEELSVSEAEARKIEADAIIRAEQEAAAREAEEAAALEEAKAKAGYETGITYDQLARTPDDYKGELVKFTGKVIQVLEGDEEIDIRLAVDKNYDTVLFCAYDPQIVSSRILENDIITIYGVSGGLYSYQSTFGGKITIPSVLIEKID